MPRSKIAGIGMYVPANVVTNNDLKKYMETSDEWIQERTGIKERRYAERSGETTTTMGVEAAKIAIERAGTTAVQRLILLFSQHYPPIIIFRAAA
jgi:3-oxoacyl-[acyl-carrier-protein] synthase-3